MRLAEGLEFGAGGAGPGGQRRARRVYVRAGVDRLLSVVRNVIDEPTDQHVRDEARRGQPLVDQLRGDRLLSQRLAALAGPLSADVAVCEEFGRHDVQAVAHVLADAHHRATAVGLRPVGVLRLVVVVDATQVFRNRLAARPALGVSGGVEPLLFGGEDAAFRTAFDGRRQGQGLHLALVHGYPAR